jgi:hypothetical protein
MDKSNEAINKAWADWHDKMYPTDFNKACNDSRKRQEEGRKQIADRLNVVKRDTTHK